MVILVSIWYALTLAAVVGNHSTQHWLEGGLLILGVVATLVASARRLSAQNVAMVAVVVGLGSALVTLLSAKTDIPFGPRAYTERFGARLFGVMPWPAPLVWICVLLNSRAVARLILRPWRKTERYGLWLIGLAAALAVVTDLALEPYAAQVQHYWIWQTVGASLHWQPAPLVNFLGWLVTAVVLLVLAAPWLINKRPVKHPPDFLSLALWLMLNLYLVAALLTHGFPVTAVISATLCVGVGLFAVRGATW